MKADGKVESQQRNAWETFAEGDGEQKRIKLGENKYKKD